MRFNTAAVASATLYLSVRAQAFNYDGLDSQLYVRDLEDADLNTRDLLGDFYDEIAIRDAEAEAGQYRKQMSQFRKAQKASGASKEDRRAAIKQYRQSAKAMKAQRQATKSKSQGGGGPPPPPADASGGGGGGGGDPSAGGGGPPPDAGGGGGGGGGDPGAGGGGDGAARKRSIEEDEEEFYLLARGAGRGGYSMRKSGKTSGFSKVPMASMAGGVAQVAVDAGLRSTFSGRSLEDDIGGDYMEDLLARDAEDYSDAEMVAWF
ncbi:MAG: hypothetical protein GOMPHAMPRED_000447 [Gomphillus americanus]|uniref:Uncharacterized protein n=1 Tax=Gomphillus americanus TaxID=1940652 RepID=A0A8H3EE81_9LECA|nr:MAG: hypothetical protein GOMPHAMPRED_000447 [Gomphillus americanus]